MRLLSDLAEIQTGYPFRARLEHDPAGDIAVLQMKDVAGDRISDVPPSMTKVHIAGEVRRYLLKRGDILFRSRGQTNTAALIAADLEQTLAAAPLVTLRAKRGVLPDYLAWYINHPTSQSYLRGELKGTSVQMISMESLGRLTVIVPSVEKQTAIAALAALGADEQRLMEMLANLKQRRLEEILWRYAQDSREKAR